MLSSVSNYDDIFINFEAAKVTLSIFISFESKELDNIAVYLS